MSWCDAEHDRLAWGTLTWEECEVRDMRRKPQEVATPEECCLGLRRAVWVKWNPICVPASGRTREWDRVPALQAGGVKSHIWNSFIEAQLPPFAHEYPVVSVPLVEKAILPHQIVLFKIMSLSYSKITIDFFSPPPASLPLHPAPPPHTHLPACPKVDVSAA